MKILLCDIDEIRKAMYTNSCKCVSKNAYNNSVLVKFGQFKRYLPCNTMPWNALLEKILKKAKHLFFSIFQQNNV